MKVVYMILMLVLLIGQGIAFIVTAPFIIFGILTVNDEDIRGWEI